MHKGLIDVNLGQAIKEGLKKKRISQLELAKTMKVSPSLVSAWVKNQRVPTGKDIIRLAILLDIVPTLFPGYAKVQSDSSPPWDKEKDEYNFVQEIEKLKQADQRLEQKIRRLEKVFTEKE